MDDLNKPKIMNSGTKTITSVKFLSARNSVWEKLCSVTVIRQRYETNSGRRWTLAQLRLHARTLSMQISDKPLVHLLKS